jgi:hypothetical protein
MPERIPEPAIACHGIWHAITSSVWIPLARYLVEVLAESIHGSSYAYLDTVLT